MVGKKWVENKRRVEEENNEKSVWIFFKVVGWMYLKVLSDP